MHLHRLLVIADQDDSRQSALRAAVDLTKGIAAQITLVGFVYDTVVDHPKLASEGTARRLKSALLKNRQQQLRDAVANVRHAEAAINLEVVWAKDIAAWVSDQVKPADYDLLIKAGHRSESLIYTPTDWQLLRESRVPVMIVRDKLQKKAGRVLAAVDLGTDQPSQMALNKRVVAAAAGIARQLGGELYVVYAAPLSAVAQDLALVDRNAFERRVGKQLAREIAELCEEFNLPADHFRLKAGPPDRIIDGFASKLKATLVVMGTIGRKGLKGKLLGNTAEKVLHRNRTTVLALRPDN